MLVKGALLGFIMVLVSLAFKDKRVFGGVLAGVVLSYGDFWVICAVSEEILKVGSRAIFWGVQVLKYLVFAAILGLLFYLKVVNPVATVVGLSLIFLIPFTEVAKLKNI
ncbi:hypothetical protein TST_0523 [Thermosulfidibacter takaii ABI70S6]|uniref:Uncharacterized protein n=2 Tax=Thermosulfidibacter takaii TaxID=412593 RepID=A0A0S3QSS2_THET7|nr:hypothetical protein TST_0523 [Thermosulfidibacter takaii ABI70S6]